MQFIVQFFRSLIEKLRPLRFSIVDRLILLEFFRIFIPSLLLFTSIYIFSLFVNDLPYFVAQIEAGNTNITTDKIFSMYLNSMPHKVLFTSPLAFLFAAMYVMGQFYKNNEAVAYVGAGVPIFRVVVGLLGFGLFYSFLLIFVNDYWIVPAYDRSQSLRIEMRYGKEEVPTINLETFGQGGLYYFIREYKIEEKTMLYPLLAKASSEAFSLDYNSEAFFPEQSSSVLNGSEKNIENQVENRNALDLSLEERQKQEQPKQGEESERLDLRSEIVSLEKLPLEKPLAELQKKSGTVPLREISKELFKEKLPLEELSKKGLSDDFRSNGNLKHEFLQYSVVQEKHQKLVELKEKAQREKEKLEKNWMGFLELGKLEEIDKELIFDFSPFLPSEENQELESLSLLGATNQNKQEIKEEIEEPKDFLPLSVIPKEIDRRIQMGDPKHFSESLEKLLEQQVASLNWLEKPSEKEGSKDQKKEDISTSLVQEQDNISDKGFIKDGSKKLENLQNTENPIESPLKLAIEGVSVEKLIGTSTEESIKDGSKKLENLQNQVEGLQNTENPIESPLKSVIEGVPVEKSIGILIEESITKEVSIKDDETKNNSMQKKKSPLRLSLEEKTRLKGFLSKDRNKILKRFSYSKEQGELIDTDLARPKKEQKKQESKPSSEIVSKSWLNRLQEKEPELYSTLMEDWLKKDTDQDIKKAKDFEIQVDRHRVLPFPPYFEYRIDAKEIRWEENQWVGYEVEKRYWNPKIGLVKVDYSPKRVMSEILDQPSHFLVQRKQIDRLTFAESMDLIQSLKKARKPSRDLEIDLYANKRAFQLSTVLILFVGMTLGSFHSRKVVFLTSLFQAVLIFLLYFVVFQLGISLAKIWVGFPVFLAPWTGNLAFFILGIILMKRVRT